MWLLSKYSDIASTKKFLRKSGSQRKNTLNILQDLLGKGLAQVACVEV